MSEALRHNMAEDVSGKMATLINYYRPKQEEAQSLEASKSEISR